MTESADKLLNESILEILQNLIELKKIGDLDAKEYLNNQEKRWRNKLEYEKLEKFLIHPSEQIRLETLELLSISKKSTQSFTKYECDLIIYFLKNNFGEKIEFVPYIKKVLKRVNSSYEVFKREILKKETYLLNEDKNNISNFDFMEQSIINDRKTTAMYQNFLSELHQLCFKNLYLGAVNNRRKFSLQILCLMNEYMDECLLLHLWDESKYFQLFECILIDTYELNKEMAFKLIKASDFINLHFNTNEKIMELVNVAIDLGNSIRPLDSLTASYLFKICLLIPNISEVLVLMTNINNIFCENEKEVFCIINLLMLQLKEPTNLAKKNIVVAASKHSLYGYLFCIHSILKTINISKLNNECWRELFENIINTCFDLNSAVSKIVNNSSPEGHLPMDLDTKYLDSITDNLKDVVITPQMVLLCSWRTVKEISLLFGYLVLNLPIINQQSKNGIITENQVAEIGNRLVIMLYETKHRGAFEQTHVGFGQLCKRLFNLQDSKLKNLPRFWLQQIILSVLNLSSSKSNLCSTRRSAGIPFMVQAIITSEINKKIDCKRLMLHSLITILLKFCELECDSDISKFINNLLKTEELFNDTDELKSLESKKFNKVTEIKTHAMNILRALFKHSQLGDLVKDYVGNGFIVAIKNYDGDSWMERNAATLLFSSLVVRVFGVQRTKDHVKLTVHNKMTGKIFFEKYPSLLPFLLNELAIFTHKEEKYVQPKIQSILLIISRLYASSAVNLLDDDWKIDEFIDLVIKCGKSKDYKTRELSARALVPLLNEKNIEVVFLQLLDSISSPGLSFNLIHAYALQLYEIIETQEFSKIQVCQNRLNKFFGFIVNIENNLESLNNKPGSFPVATLLLNIVYKLDNLESYSYLYLDTKFNEIIEKIYFHLLNSEVLKYRCGKELYEKIATKLLIHSLPKAKATQFLLKTEFKCINIWNKLLTHKNSDVKIVAWSELHSFTKLTHNNFLCNFTFNMFNATTDTIQDSDLEDSMFKYFYDSFHLSEFSSTACKLIVEKIIKKLNSDHYYPRQDIFRLLGKAFGVLLKNKDIEFMAQNAKFIFNSFFNHSQIDSNIDCRIGISEVLLDIYMDLEDNEDYSYLVLEWWTMLLFLLYDDNLQVRLNTAKIVSKIKPMTDAQSSFSTICTFFDKFYTRCGKNKEVILAAVFAWSMISASVDFEEMDESDVFNRSCNYEVFEPLQILNHCLILLKKVTSTEALNSTISISTSNWIRERLQLNSDFEFKSIKDLVHNYKQYIPSTEKQLKRILDPTFPTKFTKEISYNQFAECL